ncbi:uncharacterized protein LOC134439715 [Engraulis encrasicolus]|uniref:uncharacterized protein LOC134439715 n=1 Tax=Engraulis encrasicolus TaxID=184585 RepID=UPI002FCFADB5
MYLQQRFLVAAVFAFMWYCLDYGQVTLQLSVLICVLFSLNFFKGSVECSTQTDELAEQSPCQEVDEEIRCGHRSSTTSFPEELQHGFQYLTVKRSLREVFECAYTQSVLPWYTVPESTINQPFHAALKTEFDLFVDRLICRAREFDLCDASIGCVRILTQHLHNAKQSTGGPLFNSRTEEMAVLRVFSEALVRNLLPESLWNLELYRCILNEVVALKVLDLLVTWLSDPDNLNQLVVSQLDRVAVSRSVESLCESQRDDASTTETEDTGASTDDEEDVPKRKRNKKGKKEKKGGKRLKQGWTKFIDKMKTKKAKKKELKMKEQELIRRALSHRRTACITPDGEGEGDEEGGGGGSNTGSGRSSHIGSDGEDDSDLESYLTSVQEDMMEFKLSYEMWRVGNWTVVVNKVEQKNEDLCFTVHLEERDNPDNLHWDVTKTGTDLLHFHSRWQDMSGLPSISAILAEGGQDRDAAFLEEAKTILQNFLQELVDDEHFGHSQPVFQFLCPLDRLLNEEEPGSGVWGLLSGIAYFLTPGQEEEEHNGPGADTQSVNDMKFTAATVHEPETSHRSSKVNGQDQHAKGDIPEPHHPASLNGFSSSESNSRRCSVTSIKDFNNDPNNKYGSKTNLKDCIEEPALTNGNGPEESEDVPHSSGPLISGLNSIAESFDEFLSKAKAAMPKMHNNILTQGSDSISTSTSTSSLNDICSQTGSSKVSKRDKLGLRKPVGKRRGGRDIGCQAKEASLPPPLAPLDKNANQAKEHLEATKAIFDLLKEISGNSLILNIFDAILKPVMPLVKKKVNSFMDRMNPTEEQMASYIDLVREKQWPNGTAHAGGPKPPPRTPEDMNETRERAQQLINTRYSNFLVLKKTDVETVFKLFQDTEENKKLVYMILSFLLHQFLPGEPAIHVITQLYVKDIV